MSPVDDSRTGDPWPAPSTLFRSDEQIGGRYRIVQFVGEGAMGEVYAARDLELGGLVALKALRVGPQADRDAIERFKREILLARRVSHPNVCRIYDLGVHLLEQAAGRPPRPVLFLTMELLEGRTLVDRIAEGPLGEEEAVAVARQLAEALHAAHAAGVVHRDFKSSNILLVDTPEGVRCVVTDFGLAREARPDVAEARLTATGGVLGTPAYMAPEQVEGRPADARSDLYSFGVVLYEMLTGALPFEGESPLSVAIKRLREEPIPAERRRPELSPRARGVLRRCLERDPSRRFGDAREIVAALAGEPAPARATSSRRLAAGLALALVAALALLAWLATRPRAPRPPVATGTREAIAVLPLRNATGRAESAWLGTALAEMLTTELAGTSALRAVPGETVSRVARDLGLEPGAALGSENLARLRRSASADLALTGSYVGLGEPGSQSLRIDLRLQRTRPGAPEPAPSRVEGSEADLFALVARAGEDLRAALGLPAPAPERAARSALPRGGAARLYAEGLDLLRTGAPLEATARFQAALVEDPEAPLVWSALSEAWSSLGWSERALEAAREAFERRDSLGRVEASLVEGRFRLAAGEWEPAIEIHRALWRLFGDDPEHGLRLAQSLLEADRAREALVIVAELRALPAPASEDPRIDLLEARAADGASEFRRQLEAAERALAGARAAGSRTLAARALYEQGLARRRLGDPEASRRALAEARRAAEEVGDRAGAAMAVMALANLERAAGELGEAAALYAEARATFAAVGNRQREARAEFMQAQVVSQQGDLEAALDLYGASLAKAREVGDRRAAASALSNIGSLLYERGDLAGALARHEEAIAEFRALGDSSRVVVSLQNLAQIRQDQGQLDAAASALEEELAVARQIEDRTGEGYALKGLGDLLAERGRFEEAAARYEEAGEVLAAAGQRSWQLYAGMANAVLDRERGFAGRSAATLEAIAAELGRSGMPDDRDEAELQRLRSLVAAGGSGSALEPLDAEHGELLERAGRSEVRRLRHLARLTAAELARSAGRLDEAARLLAAEESASREAGLVLFALEARAAAALVAVERGDPHAGRRLSGARAEAERLGAGRIAKRLAP